MSYLSTKIPRAPIKQGRVWLTQETNSLKLIQGSAWNLRSLAAERWYREIRDEIRDGTTGRKIGNSPELFNNVDTPSRNITPFCQSTNWTPRRLETNPGRESGLPRNLLHVPTCIICFLWEKINTAAQQVRFFFSISHTALFPEDQDL